MAAVVFTVLSIGAVWTANLTAVYREKWFYLFTSSKAVIQKPAKASTEYLFVPISDPAGITVGALPIDAVAVMAVFTRWTFIFAVLSKKAWRTHLITFGAVPASLAGNAASFCDLTWLLTFTMTTSARRGDSMHHHTGQYANPDPTGPMPVALVSGLQPYLLV